MIKYLLSALGFIIASAFFVSTSLAGTTTFVCDYKTYSDPEGTHRVNDPFVLTFLIDTQAEKSYMVGNNGSSEVKLFANDDGFTLVEITEAGNVMVTAITYKGKSVHSRSTMMVGDIVPSQYYGSCVKK
jgi:hypothetical protein